MLTMSAGRSQVLTFSCCSFFLLLLLLLLLFLFLVLTQLCEDALRCVVWNMSESTAAAGGSGIVVLEYRGNGACTGRFVGVSPWSLRSLTHRFCPSLCFYLDRALKPGSSHSLPSSVLCPMCSLHKVLILLARPWWLPSSSSSWIWN